MEFGGGKSRCHDIVFHEINAWDKKKYKEYQDKLSRYKPSKDKNTDKPVKENMIVRDITIEGLVHKFHNGAKSLGLIADEAGQFFAGHSMREAKSSVISTLSKLLDNGCVDKVRKEEDFTIIDKRFCMHFMMQPQMADKYLFCPDIEDQGLLSRILISYPKSNIGNREISLPKNSNISSIIKKFYSIQEIIYNIKCDMQTLELDTDAQQTLVKFAQEIEDNMGKNGVYFHIRNYVNKMSELCLRLSANLYIYDQYHCNHDHPIIAIQNGDEITPNYVEIAIDICKFYCKEILKIKNNTKDEDTLYEFVRWLYTKYHLHKNMKEEAESLVISARNVISHFVAYKKYKSPKIKNIMMLLRDEGWILENHDKQFVLSRYIWQEI